MIAAAKTQGGHVAVIVKDKPVLSTGTKRKVPRGQDPNPQSLQCEDINSFERRKSKPRVQQKVPRSCKATGWGSVSPGQHREAGAAAVQGSRLHPRLATW